MKTCCIDGRLQFWWRRPRRRRWRGRVGGCCVWMKMETVWSVALSSSPLRTVGGRGPMAEADTDGDGVVSRSEMEAAVEARLAERGDEMRLRMTERFDAIDANGDDFVTGEELADHAFSRLDADGTDLSPRRKPGTSAAGAMASEDPVDVAARRVAELPGGYAIRQLRPALYRTVGLPATWSALRRRTGAARRDWRSRRFLMSGRCSPATAVGLHAAHARRFRRRR